VCWEEVVVFRRDKINTTASVICGMGLTILHCQPGGGWTRTYGPTIRYISRPTVPLSSPENPAQDASFYGFSHKVLRFWFLNLFRLALRRRISFLILCRRLNVRPILPNASPRRPDPIPSTVSKQVRPRSPSVLRHVVVGYV
jgi:hypothetical protein